MRVMDTRVIRPRGVWESVGVQWQQHWWVIVLLIVLAVVMGLGYKQFDKEFPPFVTISKGPVEAMLMADKKNPARLKKLVSIMTASKVGAWERYPTEKPIVQCTVTPIKAGYEISCEFPRDGFVLVKQRRFASDQEVKQFLWDLHRDAVGPDI